MLKKYNYTSENPSDFWYLKDTDLTNLLEDLNYLVKAGLEYK